MSNTISAAKQYIRRYKTSKNPFYRMGFTFLQRFWKGIIIVKLLLTNGNYRSIIMLRLLKSRQLHQTASTTFMNRYPDIFKSCQDYFGDRRGLKILSYGCSTGEEVLSLRQYFPHAQIIGAEINKHSLAKCKALPVDDNITFINSIDNELEKHGPYDAIFCMAVLQRRPHYINSKGITSLKNIYPFEKFEEQIVKLDTLVKSKGLLIVHFTQYLLQETTVGSSYTNWGECDQSEYTCPVFDKNSNILKGALPQKSIFIKG